MLQSFIQPIWAVLEGVEGFTTTDYLAAAALILLTITTVLWWLRGRAERQSFARTCRNRGLSIHGIRVEDIKDKEGRLVATRQTDCWQDPKFKVLRRNRSVVGVRIRVPPGVGRERVEAARDDLGSVFGLDLLPPERSPKDHNTYTFSAANFGKKPGAEGGWE
jgi:hypothetical protein